MTSLSVIIDYLALQSTLIVITDESRGLVIDTCSPTRCPHFSVGAGLTLTVEDILDLYDDDISKVHHFLIYCDLPCLTNILYEVNTHDQSHEEQGILTYVHRWVVVVETEAELGLVQPLLVNITHISALLYTNASQNIVYSGMWKPEGRRFEKAAVISSGKVTGNIFPNLNFGLNGRRLKITTLQWAPFIFVQEDKNGTNSYYGLCIELLDVVASHMNFTYMITEPSDGYWGSYINGSWTGLVREMHVKESDMVVAPLSIQHFREEVMDFCSYPYYFERNGILYKEMTGNTGLRNYFLFILPFKWQIWITLIFLVPIVGIIVHLMAVYKCRLHQDDMSNERLTLRIWEAFGIICAQGLIHACQGNTPYLVLFFWALTCLIFTASYTGNMAAMLTVEVQKKPFNNLEDLASQTTYKYGFMGATALQDIFRDSEGVYQQIWRNIQAWKDSGLPVLSPDAEDHMKLLDEGTYAYIGDRNGLIDIQKDNPAELRLITIYNFPFKYSLGFQNNSAYKNQAELLTMQMRQNGILYKWEEDYIPTVRQQTSGTSLAPPAIGMRDMAGVFGTFGVMLFVCVVTLLMEIWRSEKNRTHPTPILVKPYKP